MENINIQDSDIKPEMTFKHLVYLNMQKLTNFPYIEKDFDALTDYQLLCLVVKYLNDVIENSNEQNESIMNLYNAFLALQDYMNNQVQYLEDEWNDKTTELETAFNQLHDYVQNYFANLDVQEEIDNKLDEYVADGTLEHIIASYLDTQKIYNTHAEMIADASSLVDGLSVQTLGYNTLNDGGGAFYYITDTASLTDYQEDLGGGLYATLINKETESIKVFGGIGDGVTNDLNAFIKAMSSNITTLLVDDGNYLFNGTFNITKNVKGKNSTIIMDRNNEDEFGIILTADNIIVKDLQFRVKSSNKLMKISSSNFIKILNCKLYTDTNRTTGGLLDIYTSNHNIDIENCYFETHATNTGGLWVREGTTDGNSSDITFNNCKFIGDTVDETLAIWGWKGTIENVTVNNSHIIRPENNDISNSFPITLGQSGITKNSGFNNCTFDIYTATSGIIRSSNINDSGLYVNNCIINTYMETLSNGIGMMGQQTGTGFIIKNSTINLNNITSNPPLAADLKIIYDNCTINCSTQCLLKKVTLRNCIVNNNSESVITVSYGRSLIAYNCIFNNINSTHTRFIQCEGSSDIINIDSCKFNFLNTAPDRFIYASNYSATEDFIVKDSMFKGIIYANASNISNGYVIGCYTDASSIGNLSANLTTANNTVEFSY